MADATIYAKWTANELIYSGKTINRTYGDATSDVTFTGASNGTGTYTYTEKSEKNSQGTATNYISVSGTKITIQGTIPAGTYTYVITAKDSNSLVTKDATYTINVAKVASSITCKSAQNYTGSAITSYSSSSGCTPGTNKTVTNAGTYTVSCTGDGNHNDSSCSFTVNKVAATLSCSNKNYTGGAQTGCSCSGGTVGGTYSATNAGTYTASCSPDGNHTAPSNQSWTINKATLTITAKDQSIIYGSSISTSLSQVTSSGLVSGDSITGITLKASTTEATSNGKITPSAASTSKGIGNYNVTYNTGNLTITRTFAIKCYCIEKEWQGSTCSYCHVMDYRTTTASSNICASQAAADNWCKSFCNSYWGWSSSISWCGTNSDWTHYNNYCKAG